MPPAVVKTVKDLIYWQYAKIIADSAGIGKKDYGFVMNKFKQLRQGSIAWNEIREYVKERGDGDECVFCGATANLTLEHLLPQKVSTVQTRRRTLFGYAKAATRKKARRGCTSTLRWTRAWKQPNTMCRA